MNNQFNFYFDKETCLKEIRGHYEWCLEQLGNILLSMMQKEVIKTVDGKTPGREEWRDDLRAKLKVVSKEITDKFISVEVGLDGDAQLHEFIRAMLIDSGSGSKRKNSSWRQPIATKPGEYAWDDNLEYLRFNANTDAESEELPEAFNQSGNEFISNAVRRVNTYAPRYIKALNSRILQSIKSNIYYTNKR